MTTLTKEKIEAMRKRGVRVEHYENNYEIGKQFSELCTLALRGLATMPRPIEDAPKDGTHIYALFDDSGITPPTTIHWFGPPDLPGLRAGGWYISVQDQGSDRKWHPRRFISISSLESPKP